MGVWSSISFWHHRKRKSFSKPCISRHSNQKQILNINPDNFSNVVHQDVKEFRIQEALPEIFGGDEEQQHCPSTFEYSMGGNLKVYKEHLKQDYLETKISRCLGREKKLSHSDNDSDPEALRYSRKCHTPSNDGVITEEHGVELSFDDYSTIYEPEFLIDIKSQPSMVKKPANETLEIRKTNKSIDEKKANENNKSTTALFEKELSPLFKEDAEYDIKEQSVFDYYSGIIEQETTKNNEFTQKQDAFISQNKLVTKKKEIVKHEAEKKCEVRKSSKISNKKKEENLKFSKNILEASQTILVNVRENSLANFSLCLDKQVNDICDESSCNEQRKHKKKGNLEEDKETTEYYPESPKSEINFSKTPCSTRHNSLEILTDTNENREESSNGEIQLSDHPSPSAQLQENYNKLPNEFQEIARRLSKKDKFPRPRPSLYQINSNFSCSSSTCSTISLRSPNSRAISRTPSYKMPKTPSLSRHHPATYVTQHTSSRSRPSSHASSRATSPTRKNHERPSFKELIEYTLKREAGNQHSYVSTSSKEKIRNSKLKSETQNDIMGEVQNITGESFHYALSL